jgi:hypothetical protein
MTESLPKKEKHRKEAPSLFKPSLMSDLQFFNGSSRSIFSQINKTLTSSGAIVLAATLSESSSDIDVIEKRQEIVKHIGQNEQLRRQLKAILKSSRRYEEDFLSIWSHDEKEEIARQIEEETRPLIPALSKYRWYESIAEGLHKGYWLSVKYPVPILLACIGGYQWWNMIFSQYKPLYGRFTPATTLLEEGLQKPPSSISRFSRTLLSTRNLPYHLFFAAVLYSCKNYFPSIANKHLHQSRNFTRFVVTSAQGAISLIHSLESFHTAFQAHLPPDALPHCLVQFSQSRAEYMEFVERLEKFIEGKKNFELFYTLRNNFQKLASIVMTLGEIDAYFSMGMLYHKHKAVRNKNDERITYSFAKLLKNNPVPSLTSEGFWNPIIDTKIVQTSDLSLGGSEARSGIITGPNAGGKSMNLRSLLINIMFAQSYGLASARKLSLAPFSLIIAQLKSIDDTASDKSRFKLEAMSIREMLRKVRMLPEEQFAFVVTDELFTGTEIQPAIDLSMAMGKIIASMPNVIYLLATHYTQLTELERQTNSVFKNYCVTVLKADGSLVYPYKLLRGIGEENVALDIFLEQMKHHDMEDDELYKLLRELRKDHTYLQRV